MYKYFSQNDFTNAHPACKIENMDSEFMLKLDRARENAGVPFIVNSAYRSEDYERGMGRDGTSSHTKGLAIDIKAETSGTKFKIVKSLILEGFTRIGVAKTFIHVDNDFNKDQEVLWPY